jgi:micrococcal nuclease|tara:strand:- start:4600 stop:5049 length:450 start_codon:yes stop_codon:yes gene_type:complete
MTKSGVGTIGAMYRYRAKIIRVIDGDTIDVDLDLGFDVWLRKQRVRLYGIDTPESRTSDAEEKKYGTLSKNKLKDFCKEDSWVTIETHVGDEKGKFGRILANIWLEETNVNQWLIDNKYAVAYFGQSKDDIEKAHLTNRKILQERNEVE